MGGIVGRCACAVKCYLSKSAVLRPLQNPQNPQNPPNPPNPLNSHQDI